MACLRASSHNATQAPSGYVLNAWLVFDYQDASHFKFAGMDDTSNEWAIKERDGDEVDVCDSASENIVTGHWYDLEVEVSGITATLKVDGQEKVDCTFQDGIVGGQVGLRVDDAHSHFKEVALKSFVQVTSYYYFNGMRVALRKDNRVVYLAGDHPSLRSGRAWARRAWW